MNQQNNDNQLAVLPRRSRRLATIKPAAHWISMGYSEDVAQLMEELQNDMKKYCDGNDTEIVLESNVHQNIPLPYHDMMIPHWKRLFKALKGRTNIELGIKFEITGIKMPLSVLNIMLPALQTTNLTDLLLYNVGLGTEGHQYIASFLNENSSLEKLALGADEIVDVSAASAFSDALSNLENLKQVIFVLCGLYNTEILGIILEGCKTIRQLYIMLDNLGSQSVILLANFIRSNHSVEYLGLRDNKFTDSDTELLASALKMNTHLKLLDLQENNEIAEEGEKSLLKAMFDPTSMDSIVECNHVCKAYTNDHHEGLLFSGFGLDRKRCVSRLRFYLEREALYINGLNISIQKKIRMKVVLALCGLDGGLFDLSHFNDLPLGVMPRVLELIQKHATTRMTIRFSNKQLALEKDALSRLFHTLRGWELPLLFVNLCTPSANVSTGKRKRRKTCR